MWFWNVGVFILFDPQLSTKHVRRSSSECFAADFSLRAKKLGHLNDRLNKDTPNERQFFVSRQTSLQAAVIKYAYCESSLGGQCSVGLE